MSTVLEERAEDSAPRFGWAALCVFAGLAALYVPTLVDLARGAWREDEYAHGPLVLAISGYLLWRGRAALHAMDSHPAPRAGGAVVGAGLLLWLVGRTQALVPFEAGSLPFVAAGLVAMAGGAMALRRLAFPLLFLAFYVPLPGFVLDQATAPLKAFVSSVVGGVLALLGHAVERTGVVLAVDGREMLVADACSGLNSIVSLMAMGLLYAHLRGTSRSRMAALALAVIPIAVAANILRVLVLALVTVHHGPEAAQGWVHDAAGFAVFGVSLLLLMLVDRLGKETPGTPGSDPGQTRVRPGSDPGSRFALVGVGALMAGLAVAAPALKPVPDPAAAAFDLEAAIPVSFGTWRIDPDVPLVAPAPDVQANLDRLYRQIIGRTYVNAAGEHMMLTVAHGGDQSDALKAHRQEACYRAQGFDIDGLARGRLQARGRDIPVTRFHALRGDRSEPVTYWFTMGDRVVLGRLERLGVQLANGARGRVPDGLLVRVSSLDADPARAYAAQQAFVAALATAATASHATRLVGAPR